MDETNNEPKSPGLNLTELVVMLFKHKWKLLGFGLLGLLVGGILFFASPAVYESTAKVLVRYVIEQTDEGLGRQVAPPQATQDTIINAEMEILTSLDLIAELFETQQSLDKSPVKSRFPLITVERLLGKSGGPADLGAATVAVARNLTVANAKGSKVISIAYKHRDPELAREVLRALIELYLEKHAKVHRPSNEAAHLLDQQTSIARSELDRIEADLTKVKAETEVITLAETAEMLNSQLTASQEGLQRANVELVEQRSRVAEIERLLGGSAEAAQSAASQQAAPATVLRYRFIIEQIAQVRQTETTLGVKFAPGSEIMQRIRSQRERLERDRAAMEKESPQLLATIPAQPGEDGSRPNLVMERARLKAVEEKVQLYTTAVKSVREQSEKFAKAAPRIASLERDRVIQEENYKLLKASSDKARLDMVFDTSKVPNINIVQQPSMPKIQADMVKKIAIGIALGGFGVSAALILLFEMLLNRTIKRPLEIETRLGIPMWQSIPQVVRKALRSPSRKALTNGRSQANASEAQIASWDAGHFIRPFAESIRDRLVLFFEQNGLTRKPKLVGVTGWTDGAGTSTLASGLAAALSETGDGKVLLVDMNLRNAEVHGFYGGKPASQILDALKGADQMESAANNLYLATATHNDSGSTLMFPKRFYDLLPRFQASDFDYIIFDMPPMKDSNVTLAMAGFMDKLLMVVEADKNNIVPLKRACSELVSARAKIAGVLNKTRTYGPTWLHADG